MRWAGYPFAAMQKATNPHAINFFHIYHILTIFQALSIRGALFVNSLCKRMSKATSRRVSVIGFKFLNLS